MAGQEENHQNDEAPSNDPNGRATKRIKYHHFTQHQLHELESFFEECPRPDDRQRRALAQYLELDPLRIKFWFQNKLTRVKAQFERYQVHILSAENEELKEALNKAICPKCEGPSPSQQLRIENNRLREEIQRLSGMTTNNVGNVANYSNTNMSPMNHMPSQVVEVGDYGAQSSMERESSYGVGRDLPTSSSLAIDPNKTMIMELTVAATDELTRLALAGNSLWLPSNHPYGTEILNEDEYFRNFSGLGPKHLGLKYEGSRDSMVISMNQINLIEILMDVKQWSKVFCGIVSRAKLLEVISPGVAGNYNGALLVMSAEFQIPSPIVPTREAYFARYCKKYPDGPWVVVDVSLDNQQHAVATCRRRPSGCLLQELPNGCTKITWIEHAEVDDEIGQNIYKDVLNSGFAFGAARWVASLERECQRLSSAMTTTIPITTDHGVMTYPEGRRGILKLTERMIRSFCTSAGSSTADIWTPLSPISSNVRVMSKIGVDNLGRPIGIIFSAATSFWLPVPPLKVFNFLRDPGLRCQWDVLCKESLVQEKAHIPNGRDPGNCISLIQVNSPNSNMFILQESFTDLACAYIVYAAADVSQMNELLGGGDPDDCCVGLLPSGFAILPDGPSSSSSSPLGGGSMLSSVGSEGSLITLSYQLTVDNIGSPTKVNPNSVDKVTGFVEFSMEKIKNAIMTDINTHFFGFGS
ncbi:hypothetical protein RIF29_22820 [Crotalaria pallida]|uniref:Uncharacterized protein n=1 Tax=Crotalaria pallida TaxID=3830 RepID=A0AAN9F9Q9_CROPI